MVISTQPARFLMQQPKDTNSNILADPDMVDFASFFQQQSPQNLRVLTALRMNATFPYVLPNVWLPSQPVIDVMDAGLRDNFGLTASFRFINTFKSWLQQNTSKVVLLEIRDRDMSNWEGDPEGNDFFNFIINPLLLLQNNWYKLQDYNQSDQAAYFSQCLGPQFNTVLFKYSPANKSASASLSFHLTPAEKADVAGALHSDFNQQSFKAIAAMVK